MNFFTGFLIGVVSLIPGISGGTILVLMKEYDKVAEAICNFQKKESRHILFFLVCGILLGTLTFARIIEFLFFFFPNGVMILFSGFVLFHIPSLIKEEKIKPNFFWLFLGALFIFILSCYNKETSMVILEYPKITLGFLVYFAFCGAIDGFFTILPGVSGSMVMMILGPYYLYKSFLANLCFANIIFLFPILFYFIGDALGFYLGSKFSLYFLGKHRKSFMSTILGMVIMSVLVILPYPDFHLKSILIYLFLLLLSFLICKFLNCFK